jgi:ABC-type phosphate transport system auxiliary subunit
LQAGRFGLIHLGAVASIVKDPKKLELLKKKEDIDGKLDELRYQKAAMDPREYRQQLQTLMVQMAETQAELDK